MCEQEICWIFEVYTNR